jgi:nucleoid-associated protein YgaU
MSKDAKLGLVLGIGLIIVIAVVFFRKDAASAKAASETTAAAVQPKGTLAAAPMPVVSDVRLAPSRARRHIVVAGDTLFTLAERYYNDRSRFVEIYQANRQALTTPDRLEPGTVLVIPD